MERAILTGLAVFCGLFSIALGIADIRVGCVIFVVLASVCAAVREACE